MHPSAAERAPRRPASRTPTAHAGSDQATSGLWSITEDFNTADPDTGSQIVKLFNDLRLCQHVHTRENTLAEARRRGRVGGRPPALTDTAVAKARTMKAPGATVTQIAEVLGVARSTVYRRPP
ncbi:MULTISPECIES: helix-turn-helix domain-containing protein [unclassified Rhodococcus (in: high G+C Gram-positive bacteria)]|uniref:helix-turn-helix domain-containing protein n=1 Tax=unclassified Rhodococcus (in: high G+C Gram-positive bacteria) TaxID=192944 RepID=UPI000311C390|nr:helix-turn-helix domain-containing protein [Rhodococcus sp. DK17]